MSALIADHASGERDAGFGIETFGPSHWPQALAQLLKGYPGTAAAWWQAGFERSLRVPTNRPDQPIGMLLHGPSGLVGVTMLYASERPSEGAGSPQLHINLSSWAMAPQARERALWFARRGLANPDAVYSSLTPIVATAGILRRLKFAPVSQQRVVCFTPRLARAGERVLGPEATLAELEGHPMQPLLADHHRLGCLVCAVQTPSGWMPVVLRLCRRAFGLPSAEIIYASSTAAVARAVAPLSRFLLARGFPFMEFEADAYLPIEFAATRLFRLRLARGPYPRHGIDHLYSELVYLHR
jgi:hypothetical protein